MTTVEGHTPQQRLLRAAARRASRQPRTQPGYLLGLARSEPLTPQIDAVVTDLSTTSIQRILARYSDDPSLLKETPSEVIDKRAADLIDDETMMDRLLHWHYEFGHVPYVDGVATDAYVRGDWDDIEQAYYRDQLTDDEFTRLVERHKTQLERAARAQ